MTFASDLHETLTNSAEIYLASAWSVLPLHGVYGTANPTQAKLPTVEWSSLQRRRASLDQVTNWFTNGRAGGIGIICGKISALLVLDFDDPALFTRFQSAYAPLTETRTVQTRRGCHLYFTLPPHLSAVSRKIDGLDLLADGRYVVAPPTIVDGHEYKLIRGGRPRTLDAHDLRQINAFLDEIVEQYNSRKDMACHAPTHPHAMGRGFEGRDAAALIAPPTQHPPMRADDLARLYRYLAPKQGRNVALFQVACLARDEGWTAAQVEDALAAVHVHQPTRSGRRETAKQRQREALRTIASAFSRPARRPQADKSALPSTVREQLFCLKLTNVVRVLDGLRLRGVRAGQTFSTADSRRLLRGVVGRDSIYAALNVVINGQRLFDPPPRPPSSADAVDEDPEGKTKNAFVSGSKPGKRLQEGDSTGAWYAMPLQPNSKLADFADAQKRVPTGTHDGRDTLRGVRAHRPMREFLMPDNRALCQILGVRMGAADALTLDDLRSAKTTRMAAHRAFIQRRPGQYSTALLSGRLGVSPVTLRRYNRAIPDLHVAPMFTQTPLDWHSLNNLPPEDEPYPGVFIEDSAGKRYPPKRGLARKLLSQGRTLKLLRQGCSYYWVGRQDAPPLRQRAVQPTRTYTFETTPQPISTQDIEQLARQFAQRGEIIARHLPESCDAVARILCQRFYRAPVEPAQTPSSSPSAPPPKRSKRFFRQPLPDAQGEALAQRVYAAVNQRAADKAHKLSLTTARRWVDTYGIEPVQRALALLEWRGERVYKPVGFLATVLRCAQRRDNTA